MRAGEAVERRIVCGGTGWQRMVELVKRGHCRSEVDIQFEDGGGGGGGGGAAGLLKDEKCRMFCDDRCVCV